MNDNLPPGITDADVDAQFGHLMSREKTCRFGHQCTRRCQRDIDCPCQVDHCCAMTENCDGSCTDCFYAEGREEQALLDSNEN